MPGLLPPSASKLIYTRTLPGGILVGLLGQQISLTTTCGERATLEHLRAFAPHTTQTILVDPPGNNTSPGHGQITPAVSESSGTIVIVTDGIFVPGGTTASVIMQSRDCPVVTLTNKLTGAFAVVHASRELLKNHTRPDIVTAGLHTVAPNPCDRAHVHAYISASISAAHFTHERNPQITQHFFERFGWEVFEGDLERAAIDLPKIIQLILVKNGVPNEHVHHDGLCTYSDPRLGSYRAKKTGQNQTLVARTV